MSFLTPPERTCQVPSTFNGESNRTAVIPTNNRTFVVPADE